MFRADWEKELSITFGNNSNNLIIFFLDKVENVKTLTLGLHLYEIGLCFSVRPTEDRTESQNVGSLVGSGAKVWLIRRCWP